MNSEYLFYYSLWFWCMFDLIYNCWSRSCFSFYIFYFLSIFSYYFDLLNYSACWLYIIAHSYLFGWIRLSDCFLLLCKLLNYSDWCCSKMLDYINKINFIFLTCDFMYKSILSLKNYAFQLEVNLSNPFLYCLSYIPLELKMLWLFVLLPGDSIFFLE